MFIHGEHDHEDNVFHVRIQGVLNTIWRYKYFWEPGFNRTPIEDEINGYTYLRFLCREHTHSGLHSDYTVFTDIRTNAAGKGNIFHDIFLAQRV